MAANIDRRFVLRAWLTVVALFMQDTTYAQSKDRASRDQPKPLDVAGACLARGDNHCIVRALEGKAKSAMELGLLIETYRALEEPDQARPAMEQYVQRFPDAPRTPGYRRMLETMPQSANAPRTSPSTGTQSAPTASAQRPPPNATPSTSASASASASAHRPAPSAQSTQSPTASTSASVSEQSASPARGATATQIPLEEANACRAASDDHCIVRALEGKAQTAEELGMLCEAYRELGDNKRARAAMQQYIALFPKGNFSTYYREQLDRTH